MNLKPKVSVVIPYYKSKTYIIQTINSVLSQSYDNYEIILVDDGSVDGFYEENINFIKQNNIQYVKKINGGPASARNLGIKSASGELVAFLDADDVWHENKLTEQVDLFIKFGYQLIYTNRVEFASDLGIESGQVLKTNLYGGDILKELIYNNFITCSSVIMSRKIVEYCGYFKEDARLFAIEDYDYWLRVASKFSVGLINKPLVYYRVHAGQISNSPISTIRKLGMMYVVFFISNELKKYRFIVFLMAVKYYLGYIKRKFMSLNT